VGGRKIKGESQLRKNAMESGEKNIGATKVVVQTWGGEIEACKFKKLR